MQFNIISNLGVCLKDDGFSLDELVYRLEELCDKKACPELLAYILAMYDECLKVLIMKDVVIPVRCPHCGHDHFVLNGTQERTFSTTVGKARMPAVHRVKCRSCHKSFVPLFVICGIDKYQSKTDGVEKLALEECVQTSYRRAAKSLTGKTAITGSKSTFHRWVLETEADEIKVPEDTLASLPRTDGTPPEPVTVFADGTKCKAKKDDGTAKQGDIKVMIGIRENGTVFPVGTWTGGESWKSIGKSLEENKISFPEGSILLCDGELGLAESLSKVAADHQRCQWHISRDLYYAMNQDGASMKNVRPYQKKLWKAMAIELPAEDFEAVSEERKSEIMQQMTDAEKAVDKMIQNIRKRGFVKAATYLERSRNWMFGYVRRWLALGIVCPRASTFIERTMRELGRRVKKLAYGWKEKGLGKITNMLLKIFADENAWQEYWLKRMNINQAVMLTFAIDKSATQLLSSQTLGH